MDNKKHLFKVCLFFITLILVFVMPGGVHAAMSETDTTTLRQTDSKARAVTNDGTYIYTVVESSPTRVIKVQMSNMEEVGVLTLGVGENNGYGITNDDTYLYVVTNTSPARVVKVQKDSMTRVGAVTIGQNNASAVTIYGDYLYVVTNTNPTTVTKVLKSDLTIHGTLTLSGHTNGRAVINDGEHLYVVNHTSPTTVAKVKMSDLTIPGTLNLNTGEDSGLAVTRDNTHLYVVNYSQSDKESTVTKVQMSDMTRVGAVTLTGVIHAHSITCDNTYLYITTLTSPIKVMKVKMSTLKPEGSCSVNTVGANYYGATSVTSDNEHLYMVTYSSSDPVNVIKLRKSDMAQTGILILGENNGSAVTDDGTYLYVINNMVPTTVTKVRKSDNKRMGALTLNKEENNGSAVTNDGTYLYVVNNTAPTTVTKVRMDDLIYVDTLTLIAGEDNGRAVTNDGTHLYVVNNTAPTTVTKVRMNDLENVGTLTLIAGENNGRAVTNDGTYLYVVNENGSSPSIVTKVKMSDMTRVDAVTLTQNNARAVTNDGIYLYVVTDTSPTTVAKVRMNDLEKVGTLTLIAGENNGSAVTNDGACLYVINKTVPTKVTSIRKSDMVKMDVLTLSAGRNNGSAITKDATYLYVVTDTSPTKVARISYDAMDYTLTYTAGANGSITGTATQTVNHGSNGTAVTAVPNTGYHFVKWSDDVTTATRMDTSVTGDITVTATFALNEYTLTYAAGANGSITGTATQTVNHGSDGTAVTAVPDTGYHFVKWSDGVTTASRTDTGVTGDITVTATFALNEYTLTYAAGANGSITGAATQTVSHGIDGTAVTAVANEGYHFVKWSDDVTTATRTDTSVTGDITVTATFALNEYTLTYAAGSNGSITGTTTQTVNHGSDGTAVTAVPNEGYHFVKWSDDVTTASRTDENITENLSVTATFAINTYTLTYTAGANGNITGAATQAVSHGSDGTAVTAVPNEGYHFVKWSDDVTTATRTDTGVTGDITVTATFALNEYTLTYAAGENGSITGAATQTVNHGSNGTAVTAVPDEGYHFVKWSDDVTTATRTDTGVTGDITVTATFALNEYTLTYAAGANGSITGTATQTVSRGSDGTAVTAVANEGYHFVKWSDDVTTATRTDENVIGNISVTAEFAINIYIVTFKNWDGSELKTEIVEPGSGATAPAEPTREGYHFTGWDADFSNVTSDLTVTATFAINEYTLTYTAGANGSITGTATQTVNHGSDGTVVTAVPDTGYYFVKWSDDVTTATRTDENVMGNISVTATFAAIEPRVVTAIAVKVQPTKLTYTAGETLDLAGLIATLTYTDGSTVDVAYAQFGANGITANPDQGTIMEVAINNGQAIILTCDTHTATTGNLTVNAAPTYAITLSETGTHTFTALTVGYTPVAPITVTVTKIGTGNITNLSAALSGTDADDFTLGALDAATLDSTTTSAAFTMKPNDALAQGTYTATVTVTADNGLSQSFNISFTVNALSAPIIQSAAAGDAHVNITWSSVAGATGYKIYQSTVSGSYDAALATVSDSVYNYDAAGLSNGTTYFFVVRASIGIYDSVNSNEVSSTPQVPAPGAPVLQTAVAGDGHVNLTWSEVEGSIGYKIYASTTSGSYTSPVDTVAGSVYSYDVTGLTNGTAYYFVVTASNPGGDSGYSNEISATPQVSAPSAPTGLTATGENGKVTLSWNSTAEAAGYKIYQSEASGSYGTALTTVAESVYSYEITGLTNGVVYYFVIKATNAGGDSPYSAEVTATPGTVPGAPTNVAATAGDGQATVSFTPPADNGGGAITGYTVTSSPGNITAAGTDTTITVTGLSNGTTYTFTVTASNAAGTGPASAASNSVTPYRSSNGSSTPSTPPAQPADTGVDILVNGKTETAATAITTREGDKTVTTVVVDDKKVEERLEQEGNNAVVTIVTIPVNNGADVVIGTLNGQTVKNMESKDAVLEIKTGQVTYTLPASQINIDAVSGQIGKQVELKDIAVSVKISKPAADTVKIVEDTADKNNYQIIVKPIEFEITCSSGSKTVEVSKFSAYVERMIAIPEGVDPSKITTGVILNSDGTFSHVPTVITMIDGKYYAKINSLTNSAYLLIYSPKTFKDVGKHWAEKDVNDMASRLVVSGIGDDKFEPDRDITRAEFAAIVVRALGLMSSGTGKDAFIDVMKKNWYYDAVSIAYEYGIISGYGNGKFGPDDKITREQAMTMIARAMKITGLKVELADGEADKLLTSFTDANSAAEYAKANIASCVKAGILSGRSGKLIAPKDNITRAEVAVIVHRLLQNSNLI